MFVAQPLPSITEILFAVPQGEKGDASKNGKRSATADEFIELTNTSTKDLNLKGWTLVDSDSWAFLTEKGKVPWAQVAAKLKHDGKDWVFVFPACTLKAGECALVFNGFEQSPKGPSGTHEAAAERNKDFDRAFVFAMKVETAKVALSNDGDWIALINPDGKFVELVKWGKPDVAPPSDVKATDAPADPRGSVQRERAGDSFADHATLGKKDSLFSPGVFVPEPKPQAPKPGGKSDAQPSPTSDEKDTKK